ncbi:MAG: ATP-binding cassette domain-containing protein [Pseudomonadales bacterium]|jgi:NitT/TauT family transport system ATP-binding protein|nr:ATP-binding cassette domain-containing protein [Pseudomonadales bacterium]
MSHLRIESLRKAYGDTVVLDGIDLDLASGEFCTVVGASGCGKSTLLKLLLGQEAPTSGRLLLDGKPLPTEPSPERGIVFQRYSVFRHLTVAENVRFGLELRDGDPVFGLCFGARRRAIRARGAELLDAVGLAEVADRYPTQLSGGMQQRLALAQAIALEPPLLLLDEPFGALDPGNRSSMHGLLRELWADRGMTVVMVTHDLPEAFGLGTRMLVLDRPDQDGSRQRGARITYDIPLRRDPRPSPTSNR